MDRKFADIRLPYIFLALTAVFLVVTGIVAFGCDKAAVHLTLNACHLPWLDTFMRYYTKMGEWVPYVVVLGLLFYKAGWSLFLLTDLAIGGLIAQGLKYLFSTPRPISYFSEHYPDITLPLVDGVHMSAWYSMPSGHTISLFILFLSLSIIVCQNKSHYGWQTLFFFLAVLGAYSRIYLSMHFVEDIFGGALFATVFTFLLLFFVPKLQKKAFFDWKIKKMH